MHVRAIFLSIMHVGDLKNNYARGDCYIMTKFVIL